MVETDRAAVFKTTGVLEAVRGEDGLWCDEKSGHHLLHGGETGP
jgi:hypothetical protein